MVSLGPMAPKGGPCLYAMVLMMVNVLAAPMAALLPAVIVGAVVLWSILLYNGLVLARNRTREAWSGIDVQLKRRSSLIPNLVETVRGYATHEHSVFTEVTEARGSLAKASGPAAVAAADQTLTSALGRLMVVAEAYPQLKAVASFQQLQGDLTDTEEKVAYARQFYNQNALDYNTRIQTFPGNLFAGWFGFLPVDFFNTDETARQDVKVSFTTA